MGAAQRRGTFEERRATPKGPTQVGTRKNGRAWNPRTGFGFPETKPGQLVRDAKKNLYRRDDNGTIRRVSHVKVG